MRGLHFTWTALLLLAIPAASAFAQSASVDRAQQSQPAPAVPAAPATVGYTIFLRGTPMGHQDVTVRSDAQGLVISGQGQIASPVNVITRRVELRYRPDLTAQSLALEARVGDVDLTLNTAFENGSAVSTGMQGTTPIAATDMVSPQSVLLPTVFFGAHAVLARRLAGVAPGAEFRAFAGPGPGAQVPISLRSERTEQMQFGTSTFDVHHYELVFDNAGMPLTMQLYADNVGALVRLTIPAQGVDFVRDDIAGAMSRTHITSNPGDEAVMIPAAGFNIGATITHPSNTAGRLPAVVLVGGAGSDDRDGTAYGVAVLANLAGAASRAGFLAVRYDKRGYGQSGGRRESATMADLAEDVRAVVRWVSDRKDVDSRRIAVLGHAEGAWMAMLAAARERRIAALVSIDAPSTTGADLALEQQQHALDRLKASPADRAQKIELQKKIQAAVLSGKGWEGVPPELRKQVDTPWTQSVLSFDPASVIEDVRQPVLFVHAELDRQIPVSHVERLVDLARKESKSKSVEVVTIRGVNHLLVPAVTGESDEYASLSDLNVSKDVTAAIDAWLTRTLTPARR
jgi:pimeloyl-ACP methyl ester carboxylesterase